MCLLRGTCPTLILSNIMISYVIWNLNLVMSKMEWKISVYIQPPASFTVPCHVDRTNTCLFMPQPRGWPDTSSSFTSKPSNHQIAISLMASLLSCFIFVCLRQGLALPILPASTSQILGLQAFATLTSLYFFTASISRKNFQWVIIVPPINLTGYDTPFAQSYGPFSLFSFVFYFFSLFFE